MSPRSANARLWLMAAPFLIGVSMLVAGPLAVTIWSSFTEWNLVSPPRYVGLENFRELGGDIVFRAALRNSLAYVGLVVPLQVVGAVGLVLLFGGRSLGSRVGRAAVLVPTALPDVGLAVVWLWVLNPVVGPLNLGLAALGLPTPAWLTEPAVARWAVVIMGSFVLGVGFLAAMAARTSIPASLYELASAYGAGPFGRFRRITLPLMAPVIAMIACVDVVMALQATFVPALVVTEGGPPPYATTYLPLFAYRNAFEYLRYGYAAAATSWTIVLTAAAVWLIARLAIRWRRTVVAIPVR